MNGRQKSVLVVGGGVSGLTAGIESACADWHVTVLEARDRLGGRIYTARSDSAPVELGAEFIHGGSEFLRGFGIHSRD